MSNEVFPNAERLYRDAFALPDPAPALLELIKAHPTYAAVMKLLDCYTAVAQENPSRANTLALALVALRDSPDPPKPDGYTLIHLFDELREHHRDGFDTADKVRNYEDLASTDIFLLTSLLSGLSIKYDLAYSSDQRGNVWESLDTDGKWPTSEVRVIGACIQLLTSGSIIIQTSEPYVQSANDAATKLKVQKSRGIVKNSNARQVLELAISHAETGFKSENDIDNVWDLLFPSQT